MTPILIRDDPDFDSENLLASVLFSAKRELTSRQESSGKGDSWKLETFQMEPCG